MDIYVVLQSGHQEGEYTDYFLRAFDTKDKAEQFKHDYLKEESWLDECQIEIRKVTVN
jgi:hypothetical protein